MSVVIAADCVCGPSRLPTVCSAPHNYYAPNAFLQTIESCIGVDDAVETLFDCESRRLWWKMSRRVRASRSTRSCAVTARGKSPNFPVSLVRMRLQV
jgi:hypothetical protein